MLDNVLHSFLKTITYKSCVNGNFFTSNNTAYSFQYSNSNVPEKFVVNFTNSQWDDLITYADTPEIHEKCFVRLHTDFTNVKTRNDLINVATFWKLYTSLGYQMQNVCRNETQTYMENYGERTNHPTLIQMGLSPYVARYELVMYKNASECYNQSGAFIILAHKGKHSTYVRNGQDSLRRTIKYLYEFYNYRERNDVIVAHEGDFTTYDEKNLSENRSELHFYKLPSTYWNVYPPKIEKNFSQWVDSNKFNIGYRKMIRFYAIHVWSMMKEWGYSWVCRLDEDSVILSQIPYNIFEFMERKNFEYAYRNVIYEAGAWEKKENFDKWWSWSRDFINNYMSPEKPQWLYEANKCKTNFFSFKNCGWFFGFYNNFFVGSINRFLKSDIKYFLEKIDNTGFMFTRRWNDLIIQSLAVQLYIPQKKVHRFNDWGYAHSSGSFTKLGYGIVQLAKGSTDNIPDVIEKYFKWNKTLPKHKFITIKDGMKTLSTYPNRIY